VTLTLWHTQTGPGRTLLDALASDFAQAYPSIALRVEAKNGEGDLLKQGLAAVALNQPPDLIVASPRTIAEFGRRDALVPLGPYLDDAQVGLLGEERNDLLPGALNGGYCLVYKDQLEAFPFDARAVVLFYNADYMRAAKANLPPRTWDDFSSAARATTHANVHGWVMSPEAAVFYAFVYSRGGAVLNDAQTQVLFNGEAGVKSLQLISALTNGGAAYLAESPDKARADFVEGKATFWFGTTSDLVPVSTAIAKAGTKFQWGVASVPQNDPASSTAVLLGSTMAIFRTTEARQRSAWLLARWLTMPEQTARWSRATMALPVRLSAIALLAANLPSNLPSNLTQAIGDTLPTGRGVPTAKGADLVDQAIFEMWTAVASSTDPNAAMQRAVQRATRALGQAP
jgi:ABC-type glycerol-3-phosphate transport system substrate-binding protein